MNGIEILKNLIIRGESLKETFGERGGGHAPSYTRTTDVELVSQWIADVDLWIKNYTTLGANDLIPNQFTKAYDKVDRLDLNEFKTLMGG